MPDQQRVKLGCIGCGSPMRVMFGPIFKYLENGELVAVMDIDESKARWAQKMYGIKKIYTDLDEMLKDDEIEAVIVGSPHYLHKEHTIKAAQVGKHIFCEKPMGRTIEECDEMIKACKENKVILMIAYMKRFDKSMMYAHQLIQEGRLGKVVQIRCDWSGYQPRTESWRFSLLPWGGFFLGHGSHTIDLCRWWMGDIETVSGEISVLHPERKVEDQAVATFRHKNGGISIHHMILMTHKPHNEYYLIDGSKASLEIEYGLAPSFISTDPFSMKLYEKGRRVTNVTRRNNMNIDEEIKESGRYTKELEHFCDCVLNDKAPLTTPEGGRKAIEAINAVFLSSWKGEKVKLPLKESPDMEKLFTEIENRGMQLTKDDIDI